MRWQIFTEIDKNLLYLHLRSKYLSPVGISLHGPGHTCVRSQRQTGSWLLSRKVESNKLMFMFSPTLLSYTEHHRFIYDPKFLEYQQPAYLRISYQQLNKRDCELIKWESVV